MTYKLTLKRVLKSIRKTMEEGRLQAQKSGRIPALQDDCVYDNEKYGTRCAVGCALPKTILKQVHAKGLNKGCGAESLIQALDIDMGVSRTNPNC